MKTHQFFLLVMSLLFVNIAVYSDNDSGSYRRLHLSKRLQGKDLKSLPGENISLEAYLLETNDVEIFMEGGNVSLNVCVTNVSTGVIYNEVVEALDGQSTIVPLNLENGEYNILITWRNVEWEGTFVIEEDM